MLDIRKEMADFLEKYAHEVVYIRRDTRFRCECYVERSGESSDHCPKCFGTGYKVSIEKVRTRRNIAAVPESLVGINQLQQYGKNAPKAYVYYLEYDKDPRDNDLILEVIWDTQGVPRYIKEKHLISVIEAKFGYKGRTEFFQVYCRYDQKGDHDDTTLTKR